MIKPRGIAKEGTVWFIMSPYQLRAKVNQAVGCARKRFSVRRGSIIAYVTIADKKKITIKVAVLNLTWKKLKKQFKSWNLIKCTKTNLKKRL